jgi:hypothetical protein
MREAIISGEPADRGCVAGLIQIRFRRYRQDKPFNFLNLVTPCNFGLFSAVQTTFLPFDQVLLHFEPENVNF